MKLTKTKLKQIVRKELSQLMVEAGEPGKSKFLDYDPRDPQLKRDVWRADYDKALQEFKAICDQAAELFKKNPAAVDAALAQEARAASGVDGSAPGNFSGEVRSPVVGPSASIIGRTIQLAMERGGRPNTSKLGPI